MLLGVLYMACCAVRPSAAAQQLEMLSLQALSAYASICHGMCMLHSMRLLLGLTWLSKERSSCCAVLDLAKIGGWRGCLNAGFHNFSESNLAR